ncbi:hypothetical protein CB1_000284011 [Camelus ferus]|nr:hypothetical protein CB1_000284011 [Camelus ferus]
MEPLPPRIRLKPRRVGAGEQEPVYRAELVDELKGPGRGPRAGSAAPLATGPAHQGLVDLSSGSSGEDDGCKGCPRGKHGRHGLALLAAGPPRTGCAGESAWSGDSLDESKSSGSEVASPDPCDLSSGDGVSLPSSSSSQDARPTVPPLTVRLHTQSVSKCVTEDGRTVAVGDVVWGDLCGLPGTGLRRSLCGVGSITVCSCRVTRRRDGGAVHRGRERSSTPAAPLPSSPDLQVTLSGLARLPSHLSGANFPEAELDAWHLSTRFPAVEDRTCEDSQAPGKLASAL